MWLDNLKELKEKSGMTLKQISDKSRIPERTVVRIFAGESDHPYADTLDLIAKAMGYDLGDVFSETKVVIATPDLVEIKENVDIVEAERDLVQVENDMLKSKVAALTTEVELLKKELQHKEELLAIHNYYTKIKIGG